jgi:hypothetical protein
MRKTVYVTGRGGNAYEGLGGYVESQSDKYVGLSMSPAFLKQDFQAQIQDIRQVLGQCQGFDAVANSYGAYLLLHALIGFEHELASVKLLSPVLGKGLSKDKMFSSRPPSVKALMNSLETRSLNFPEKTFIYIGDEDVGYCPELTQHYIDYLGEDKVFVLTGERHNLNKSTVRAILGYDGS